MLETILALGVVLGGIFLLRGALRLSPLGRRTAGSLRVVESKALGSHQRLHVIEVEGRRLLLGATDGALTVLSELAPGEPETEDETAAPRPVGLLRGWLRTHGVALTLATLLLGAGATGAAAQAEPALGVPQLSLALDGMTGPDGISSSIQILALLTFISVAPSLLLMGTCFTRIIIVFAFLRQAIGVHQLPPNQVLMGLALFTTFFVMAPIGEQVRVEAYEPYVAQEIELDVASERALGPIRDFLSQHTREKDLALFIEISGKGPIEEIDDVPFHTLLPAYMISELRTAFEIGFMIYLPFLVVDLVIASLLISMQMIVLPPIVISLPFKLILFVLLDGWNLVLGSLVGGLR